MVRDWWTKKLQRIIGDIEAGKMPVSLKELYVCGAFARGELDPSELILIVIHDEPSPTLIEQYRLQSKQPARSIMAALSSGIRQFERHLCKVIRRPTEHIVIHHGTHLNQAYAPTSKQLEGLVLLWSPSDRDWRGKIASIPVPDALHPVRQMHAAIQLPNSLQEEADYLTQKITLDQLRLQRVPLEALPPMSMEEAQRFLAAPEHLDFWGVHTKPLFPYACAWLRTQNVWEAMATDGCIVFDHEFRFRLQLGKPYFRKMVLHFDRLALEKQCYLPFQKQGYPKELFVLERGSAWTPTTKEE